MKKLFALLTLFLLLLSGGSCSRSSMGIHAESSNPAALSSDFSPITEVFIEEAPFLISDIDFLVSQSDFIFVGKVEKALPIVRVDAVALGLVEGISGLKKNVSSFEIRADQVLKGEIAPGDTIRVDRSGGLAEGINEIYEDDPPYPREGSTYLMFIYKTEFTEENKYFMYMFVGTYDGFSEIIDGKILPQKNTTIFKSGTPIDEAIASVSDAIEKSRTNS